MALTVIHRRPFTKHVEMEARDEEIFREGLGYYAAPEMRSDAIDLINEYSANSRWIGCDCNPAMPRLWPVKDQGFRRDLEDDHVQHSDNCEFNQDAVPAKRVRASFARKARVDGILKFRLATGFNEDHQVSVSRPPTNKVNRSTYRPGLARLLCELLTDARVQEINQGDHFPQYETYKAMVENIRASARKVEIAEGRYLSEWIAVGLKELQSLKRRVHRERYESWKGARPHGIFLCNFEQVRDQQLVFDNPDLDPLPVTGRIAVFGEREAEGRTPYLAICLIAHKETDSPSPEVLRVYAHPCLNWSKWTLVDSKLERKTIDRIQRCRYGLSKNNDIVVRVEKPLFDLNPNEPADDQPVCIPDFTVDLLSGRPTRSIVVETMGYADNRYRNRKKRLKEHFEQIDRQGSGRKAYMVYHDPALAEDEEAAHRLFYNNLYASIRELAG